MPFPLLLLRAMSDEFDQLLAETGITIIPPAGFSPFPVREACAFRYQRAYRHSRGAEVRFRIDSIQRLKSDMGGGRLPANFSESAFVSGLMNLCAGQAGKTRMRNDEETREFFRVDWVRSAYFRPVDPQFAPDHDGAVLYYFHRQGVADVYLIGLFKQGSGDDGLMLGDEPPVQFPEFPAAAS